MRVTQSARTAPPCAVDLAGDALDLLAAIEDRPGGLLEVSTDRVQLAIGKGDMAIGDVLRPDRVDLGLGLCDVLRQQVELAIDLDVGSESGRLAASPSGSTRSR